MKWKLKNGMKVKVVSNSSEGEFPIGTIGIVDHQHGDGCMVKANDDWWMYSKSDLEPVVHKGKTNKGFNFDPPWVKKLLR
jgi:hypothetical protein